MTALLEARDLAKSYGETVAVDGVSFSVAEGECYGLLGPNGAGKTTSISMIAGLTRRDRGEVTIDGKPLGKGNLEAKEAMGLVPQNIALYEEMTAVENLKFWGRLYGMRGGQLQRRIEETLEMVGLTDRGKDRVSKFSGGMQRRLNIAAGLLHEPRLLILDEPTAGVDPQSRNAILGYVEDLKKGGTAILYTTHYMEEAERLCDRVAIIDHGKIIAEGTRRELVALVGQKDRIEVTVSDHAEEFASKAKMLPDVEDATVTDHQIGLLVAQGRKHLPDLVGVAASVGAELSSVEVIEPDLEAVFLHLTGRALRD